MRWRRYRAGKMRMATGKFSADALAAASSEISSAVSGCAGPPDAGPAWDDTGWAGASSAGAGSSGRAGGRGAGAGMA